MKQSLLRFFLFLLLISACFTTYGQQGQTSSNCNDPAGGCDTVGIQHKISPWRIGLFVGPAVAYCGTWENTFVSDKFRDKSLFNGIGFNAAFNADYYFNKSQSARLKFGLGAVAGVQNFFLRKDLDPFLDRLILDANSRNPVIQKAPSEDFYLVFGPVLDFSFTRKPRSPYLEASVRGGYFRTTPAAIFVYDGTTGNNIYSVTASNRRYYPGLLATLGFFVPSKNNLWAWGIEATGFRTKVDYIFPGATIYPFTRKHGGFSAGLAVRRRFERDIPVAKEPTPPLLCVAPEIDILMDGKSIKGYTLNLKKDTLRVDSVLLTWRSRAVLDTTTTETFTASIHQLNNGEDKIIAQALCVNEAKLVWPAAYRDSIGRPAVGQYFVTVQSNLISSCASTVCTSVTGFAVKDSVLKENPCYTQCRLKIYADRKVVRKLVKYGPSPASCKDCICPVGTTDKTEYIHEDFTTIELQNCNPDSLDIKAALESAGFEAPAWLDGILHVDVETTTLGNCPDQKPFTVTKYQATVKKKVIISSFIKVPSKDNTKATQK